MSVEMSGAEARRPPAAASELARGGAAADVLGSSAAATTGTRLDVDDEDVEAPPERCLDMSAALTAGGAVAAPLDALFLPCCCVAGGCAETTLVLSTVGLAGLTGDKTGEKGSERTCCALLECGSEVCDVEVVMVAGECCAGLFVVAVVEDEDRRGEAPLVVGLRRGLTLASLATPASARRAGDWAEALLRGLGEGGGGAA